MAEQNTPRQVMRFSRPMNSLLRASVEHEFPEYLSLKVVYNPEGMPAEEWKFQAGGDIDEIHRYEYEGGHLALHHLEMPAEGIEERFVTKRNAAGKPVEIIKFYGDDTGERTTYEYDSTGEVLKATQYDADGDFELEESHERDEKGRTLKRIVRHASEPLRILIHTYNAEGFLALIEEKNEEGSITGRHEFEYSSEGFETAMHHYNAQGKLIAETFQEYSETGLLMKRLSKGFYTRLTEYSYDEKGNLSEEALSDENGFVISRNHYEYDDQNRLVKETIYETDLTRTGRDTHLSHRYEYEFFS